MWTISRLRFNPARLISCKSLSTSRRANQARNHPVSLKQEEIQRYKEDGAICLRGKISQEWLEKLKRGIRMNLDNPSPNSEKLSHEEKPTAVFFNDYFNYLRIKDFSDFVFHSSTGELARQLMESEKVAFYHEHVFVKDSGACYASPWHHDQAYYPLDGHKNCSFWIPMSAISKENCLKYIKGSHRWGKMFIPKKFKSNLSYAFLEKENGLYSEMVDIDADPEQYEELSWDLEPGDCIAFHMLTVHGAPERVDHSGRQVFALRWLGDDIVLATRPWEVSPPILPEGFKPGRSVFDYPSFFHAIKPKD